MVLGYFVKNKMSKDNKIYSNLNTKKIRFNGAKRNVVKLIIDNSLLISNNIK